MFDFVYHTSEVKGFSSSEYLVVLLSFVYGIALSDQFYNFSIIIRKRKFYSESIIWSGVLMMTLVIYWYLMWRNVEGIDSSLIVFLVNFLPPFLFFIIVSLIFPSEDAEDYNLEKSFHKNRKAIFLASIVLLIAIMYNSLILNSYFTPLNYVRLLHTFFLLLCFHFDKRWIRNMAALWFIGWHTTLIFIIGI